MDFPSRCPRKPLRTMDVTTSDGPVLVGVWAERNGLAVTIAVEPACGYSITHLRTGRCVLWLAGLTWRQAITALSLLADVVLWSHIHGRVRLGTPRHQQLTEYGLIVEEMIGIRSITR